MFQAWLQVSLFSVPVLPRYSGRFLCTSVYINQLSPALVSLQLPRNTICFQGEPYLSCFSLLLLLGVGVYVTDVCVCGVTCM